MATEIKALTEARWPGGLRLPVALTFEHQSGEGAPLLPGDRPNAMIGGAWSKPSQASAVLRRAGPPMLGALLTYAAGAALVRALNTALLGVRAPWPGWDVVLLLVGLWHVFPAVVRLRRLRL